MRVPLPKTLDGMFSARSRAFEIGPGVRSGSFGIRIQHGDAAMKREPTEHRVRRPGVGEQLSEGDCRIEAGAPLLTYESGRSAS